MKHRQVQHSTSTTHPICYAAARRLLCSLARKSARLASWAIGLFAAEIASLPEKGTGRLPAYRQLIYHSKSHPADEKSSLKGAWSGSADPY